MSLHQLFSALKNACRSTNITHRLEHIDNWIERAALEGVDENRYDHTETVKEYYEICNELMVFGWNESLHFAPLTPQESLEDSIIRHQRLMIDKLELQAGMTVIDVGCGIGGPMRRVVREGGVRVVGINNNEIQMEKAKMLNARAGIDDKVNYVACSFMDMGVIEDNTFDAGYAIESTCHAPDKEGAFAEIFRVLKPGALFWCHEMCMTDKFDPNDASHRAIKQELMRSVALKEIATSGEVKQALEAVGFSVLEAVDRDIKEGPSTPWYQPMETRHGTLNSAQYIHRWGRAGLLRVLKLVEMLGLIPKEPRRIVQFMDRTAKAYVAGGRAGIFTPLYCFLARKPL